MNGMDAHAAQAMADGITIHRTNIFPTNQLTSAAISNGNMQYPNRQRDWKKPMVPPNSMTLIVSTIAPIDTIAKTIEKVLEAFAEPKESKTANPRVKIIGPHRSQFLRAADC